MRLKLPGLQAAAVLAALAFAVLPAAHAAVGALPGASAPQYSQAPGGNGPLSALKGLLRGGSASTELLPPDEAYRLSVRATDADTLVATVTPAPGYYVYRERIKFRIADPPGLAIEDVALPTGDIKDDPNFGKMEVYHRAVDAVIRLAQGPRPASIRLHASYQGCNEPSGVCYPPIEKDLTVALVVANTAPAQAETAESTGPTAGQQAAASEDPSDTGRIRRMFTHGGSWALMVAFFGFGLLLAFTPCMLPMIPILSGIIVGQGAHPTKRHALAVSAAYVAGMAITYAAAGVAAGLAGSLLSPLLQSPWVLGSFAAIFVLLALSMFGLYELQLPSSLQSALAARSGRIPGGRAGGAFAMGALSALIVGPCVAAPLAGALLYIAQSRDAVLGGAALFSLAVGMGVPLILVGGTAGAFMRRGGPWTESIKRFFGFTMLALAIYLVTPVIPLLAQQLLWAALLVASAMFVRAIDPLPDDAPGHLRLFKGVGVIALVAGVALLVGALSGSKDLLRPLAGIGGAAVAAQRELAFVPVKSVSDLDARLQAARGRPVMLDFWAEWCVSCKEMDRFTFSNAQVQARLKDAVLLRADVTANNADDQALLRRFSLFGPPGIVFFDTRGNELAYRVIGFEPPEQFLASLGRVLATGSP